MSKLQCPEYYAEQARKYEAADCWRLAMDSWHLAGAASAGHKRKERYYRAADRCELKLEEWQRRNVR